MRLYRHPGGSGPSYSSHLTDDTTPMHLDDLRQILLTYACIKANCTVRFSSYQMCVQRLDSVCLTHTYSYRPCSSLQRIASRAL
jgi:hypothetical protein